MWYPPTLEAAVSKDREDGFHPIYFIGNAGTVNTGAMGLIPRLNRDQSNCEQSDHQKRYREHLRKHCQKKIILTEKTASILFA